MECAIKLNPDRTGRICCLLEDVETYLAADLPKPAMEKAEQKPDVKATPIERVTMIVKRLCSATRGKRR